MLAWQGKQSIRPEAYWNTLRIESRSLTPPGKELGLRAAESDEISAGDGYVFHPLGLQFWLTPTVPATYIKKATLKGSEDILEGVRCVRCNYRDHVDAFPGTRTVYHDMRCPRCGTTELDTSVLNRDWASQGRRYGYGDDNVLRPRE